jgi:hypothetical protein
VGDREHEAARQYEPAAGVEIGLGWDTCIASLGRPAAQGAIAALLDQGFQTTGDVENRLGYYIGQLPR